MTFQDVITKLFEETRASRVTLRLKDDETFFPVIAEECASGVESIAADTSIDLRKAPTYRTLEADKEMLVQDDLLNAKPAPPIELIERFGVRAQMLAPIVASDEMVGIISVHEAAGARKWTREEIDALRRATTEVRGLLANMKDGKSPRPA